MNFLDIIKELPEGIKAFLWLLAVSFIGAVVGFITKTSATLRGKPMPQKIRILIFSVVSSMFIAYISYEIMMATIDNSRLSVAISGFAAYLGTDLLIIMQERIIEKIKAKIDGI